MIVNIPQLNLACFLYVSYYYCIKVTHLWKTYCSMYHLLVGKKLLLSYYYDSFGLKLYEKERFLMVVFYNSPNVRKRINYKYFTHQDRCW